MFKKYRSVFLMMLFFLFNIAESIYFGQGTPHHYNLYPNSTMEWICDIISFVGVFWAFIMGLYDVNSVKKHVLLEVVNPNQE